MKNTKKICVTLIVFCLVIGIAFAAFLIFTAQKPFEIKEKYSYSETVDAVFSVTEDEKANINNILESELFESEDLVGFKTENIGTDLYLANSLVEITKIINTNNTIDILKNKMSVLKTTNLQNMSMLNLIYYANICNELGIEYDKNEIMDCLTKFYDKEAQLFFLNSLNDTVNIKIVITALCAKTVSNVIANDQFNIKSGIQKAYSSYTFSTNDTITFYNSGGDIIYAYSILGLINDYILTEHRNWFDYWKTQYETAPIDSFDFALAYSEFYNIAVIFDKDYSNSKIQNFYSELNKEDLPDTADFYMISNAIKNASHFDNNSLNSYLSEKIDETISSQSIFETNIDIYKTVCGVLLAKNTDFKMDSQKLQNYINQYYTQICNMENVSDRINNLYYNIILDQQNNNYHINCEISILQALIDKSINELTFDKDLNNDIVISRKILEIVSDLQLHDYDLYINIGQVNKIIKGLEKAKNTDSALNNSLIADMLIIDDLTGSGIIDNDLFLNIYSELSSDGGSKTISSSAYVDIHSTYRFFVCFERIGDYKYFDAQQLFAKSLKTVAGIYKYSKEETSYVGLETILYGNILSKASLGGDK